MKIQKTLVSPLEQKRRLPKWEAFKLLHQDNIREFYKVHPRRTELPVQWDERYQEYVWLDRKFRRTRGYEYQKRLDFTWKNYFRELWKIVKMQVQDWLGLLK